jgi:hypothetical protein
VFGPLIICAFFFFKADFKWKDRITYLSFLLIATSLCFSTFVYDYVSGSAWEQGAVTSIAIITAIMFVMTYVAHALPRAKDLHSASSETSSETSGD